MPARRQVALGAAIVALLAASLVLAAIPSDPTLQSAAVVTTTTDPPSTTDTWDDEAFVIPTTTTTLPPTTTTAPPPPPEVQAAAASEPVPATGDRFDALAQCESGGDPTTNTGNGYYGAFQFDLQTWQSVGRSGYPHEHSYGEQKAAAMDLHARRGWHPWPACARKLGYL
jgi:hypothetical protein